VFGYDQPIPESFKPLSEEERREFFQKTTLRPLNLSSSERSLGGLLQSRGSSESYQELFRAAALAGSLFSVQRSRDVTPPPEGLFDLSIFRSAVKLYKDIARSCGADPQNLEPFFEQAERHKRDLEPV